MAVNKGITCGSENTRSFIQGAKEKLLIGLTKNITSDESKNFAIKAFFRYIVQLINLLVLLHG